MALETIRIAVGPEGWTAVGVGVVGLTVTETLVGNVRWHIVATGGAGPNLASDYQEWDKTSTYTGSAADIYLISPNGATTVGIVRE